MKRAATISMHLGLQAIAVLVSPLAAVLCGAGLPADRSATPRTTAYLATGDVATGDVGEGRLRIEARAIERLTLSDEVGRVTRVARPGRTIPLAAGRYRVEEVQLEGGFHCYASTVVPDEWFQIVPDRWVVLRVGAPLRPQVHVQRAGRVLRLQYDLVDDRGRAYVQRGAERDDPPRFTVFQDGRPIGTGSFEYG